MLPVLEAMLSSPLLHPGGAREPCLRLRLMGVRVSKLEADRRGQGICALLAPKPSLHNEQGIEEGEREDEKGGGEVAEVVRGTEREGEGRRLKYQRLCREDVDPTVFAELPAHLQRELSAELAESAGSVKSKQPPPPKQPRRAEPARNGLLATFTKPSEAADFRGAAQNDLAAEARSLVEMGFSKACALSALHFSQGDMGRAVEMLLEWNG